MSTSTRPHTGGLVEADGIRLHHSGFGEGPAVVWLHGGGPGVSGMSNFRQNLPAFEGYRSLVFDLPGFGESDKPVVREPLIPYCARQVAAALDELGVERAHIIGNSMGGGVATKIAIERPELVERLVLMGGAGTVAKGARRLPEGLRLILADIIEGASRERMEQFVQVAVHDPSRITDDLVAERHEASLDPAVRAANAQATPAVVRRLSALGVPIGRLLGTRLLGRPGLALLESRLGDLTPELDRVRARTLLVWGREDRFVPLEWGLVLLHGIPDASLQVIPHCGHWAQFEHAERFDRMVLDFLADEGEAA